MAWHLGSCLYILVTRYNTQKLNQKQKQKHTSQGISNLPEADRRIISIDFALLAQPASIGPFVGFIDPRKIIRDFASRIS